VLQPQLPPLAPARQTWPSPAEEQASQAPPESPQAPAVKPVTHTPLTGSLQQPLLQGWPALQTLVQTWWLTSQAMLAGQSAVVLQPQLVPEMQA
jgi:hypothetical protein